MYAFLFIAPAVFSQTYIVPDLQRDDFATEKTWWVFQNHGGQPLPVTKNGYLYAYLENARNGQPVVPLDNALAEMENVGIMTADQRPIYGKDDIMDVRIRVKTLNPLIPGSRGWGFWKSEGVPIVINQAVWFMEQQPDASHSWAASEDWWRARTHRTVDPAYDFSTDLDGSNGSPHNIDNMQWHYYRVVRNGRNNYDHYVDGVLVQSITPADFPDGKILNEDYSFNCWNDNLVYHSTTNALSGNDTIEVYANGWIDTTEFVVDFIEIRSGNYNPSKSYTPIGAIALREVVNEIDNGISDGNFKGPYTFNAVAGKTVILATGKAEELDSYDVADEMKMILNSTDFGYNNARSWDGLVDAGTPKTIVIDTNLTSGSHTLEFQSISTPILYDATVLSSANGSIVVNQDVNSSAPSGSNNTLWQTFNFTAEAGDVIIYISGSADEEPGWNHQNATIDSTDDDELRLELDGYDFGWGADSSSFVGNTLFGDFKTICIRRNVSSGSHTLKLYANETPYVNKVLIYAANGDVPLAIQLSSFSVTQSPQGNVVSWKVASEIQNAGFNLYRGITADDVPPADEAYVRINDERIPGRGNASSEKEYSYLDRLAPSPGQTVWYKLEDVNYNGKVTVHGPVRVTPGTLPQAFALGQNYPNPFNPVTSIPFTLQKEQTVWAEIYDVRGRRVRLFKRKLFPAGSHIMLWDGKDDGGASLPSGIYYFKIQAGKQSQAMKMTYLR
ncbi:MAG TPA: T9SS type A sorting domain-containing protein [Caldithrix abyssi]|uniref:T9SS type A sorting domain-containing protein n=1 Tax=Caldithrix abyssi TaxID=187145 RepID=A0A7V1LM18_CALAY|nr:T9SS type A sorting domain-containing protein [Caldithrix abyssi]